MKQRRVTLLDFFGSLGAILTTAAAMLYFGGRIGIVGRVLLYVIGAGVIVVSLPGVVPALGSLGERWKGFRERYPPEARLVSWPQRSVDPRVDRELKRAAEVT